MPNSVYTDTGGRITIDIDDAENAALSTHHSVNWNIDCQYINSNMPDTFSISSDGTESFCRAAYGMNA